MAEWHHWLDGREFEWTPGVGDGQGGLACWRFMVSQRVRHDWANELNWAEGALLWSSGNVLELDRSGYTTCEPTEATEFYMLMWLILHYVKSTSINGLLNRVNVFLFPLFPEHSFLSRGNQWMSFFSEIFCVQKIHILSFLSFSTNLSVQCSPFFSWCSVYLLPVSLGDRSFQYLILSIFNSFNSFMIFRCIYGR